MPYLPSLLLQRERDERLRRRVAGGGPSHLSGLGRSLGGRRRGFEFAVAEALGHRGRPARPDYGGARITGDASVKSSLLNRLLTQGLIPEDALDTKIADLPEPVKIVGRATGIAGPPIGEILDLLPGDGASDFYQDKIRDPGSKVLFGSTEPDVQDMAEALLLRGAGRGAGLAINKVGGLASNIWKARRGSQAAPQAVDDVTPEVAKNANRLRGMLTPKRGLIGAAAGGALYSDKGRDLLVKGPANLGLATAEDPIGMAGATWTGAQEAVLGAPKAVETIGKAAVQAAQGDFEQAGELWEGIKDDYSYRYGPLFAGDTEEFRERAKESGLTPFAFDSLIAAPGVSRVFGAGVRHGALGPGMKARQLAPRPEVRVAAGPEATRRQRVSRGYLGRELQYGRDRLAARRTEIGAGARPSLLGNTRGPNIGQKWVKPLALLAHEANEVAGEARPVQVAPRSDWKLGNTRFGVGTATNYAAQLDTTGRRAHKAKVMAAQKRAFALNRTHGSKYDDQGGVIEGDLSKDKVIRGLQSEAYGVGQKYGVRTPEDARRVLPAVIADIEKRRPIVEGFSKRYEVTPEIDNVRIYKAMIDKADEVFTPGMQNRLTNAQKWADSTEMRDPQLTNVKGADGKMELPEGAIVRKYAPMAQLMGASFHRGFDDDGNRILTDLEKVYDEEGMLGHAIPDETGAQFGARVQGLQEAELNITNMPSYIRSEVVGKGKTWGEYTRGGQHGASTQDRQYQGVLAGAGIESGSLETVLRGVQRSLKRQTQWPQITNMFRKGTPEELRGKDGGGVTWEAVADWGQTKGVDLDDGYWFEAKKFEDARINVEKGLDAEGNPTPARPITADNKFDDHELGVVMGETITDLQAVPSSTFKSTGRGYWVPREFGNEVIGQAEGSQLGWRLWDKSVGASSGLLLAFNLPWLAYQVFSNASTSIIGGTGPMGFAAGLAWFRDMKKNNPELYQAVAAHAGLQTSGFMDAVGQGRRVGSAVEDFGPGKMKDAARAIQGFGELPAFKGLQLKRRGGNVMNAFFRVDAAQNDFFRKAMLYSSMKRQMYEEMGSSVEGLSRTQAAMLPTMKELHQTSWLDLSPKARAESNQRLQKRLENDTKFLEEHSAHVYDFLGNWTKYTQAERNILKRGLMFYGFVRFSLRLALYTMPAKRPMTAGILGELGKLSTEEQKELLGEEAEGFVLGNIFTNDGDNVMKFFRANPVLNALTEEEGFPQVMQLMPPVISAMVSVGTGGYDTFRKKHGDFGGIPNQGGQVDPSLAQRFKMAGNIFTRMSWPLRTAMKFQAQGHKQGVDQLPGLPAPIYTKPGEESDERNDEKMRIFQEQGNIGFALSEFIPWWGHSAEALKMTNDGIIAAKEQSKESKERAQGHIPSSGSDNPWDLGGSDDNPWDLGDSGGSDDNPWDLGGSSSNPWDLGGG